MATIELWGWQKEFVRWGIEEAVDDLYLLAHGGRGSGKSFSGAARAVAYMIRYPGCTGMITAPTFPVLHDATLPSLFQVMKHVGLKEGKDWNYIQNREIIHAFNNCTILLRTTEHPTRISGPTCAWAWMDEPRLSPLMAFTNLQGTLRQEGFPHQAWATTTPEGKAHWLYKVWYQDGAIDEDGLATGAGTYKAYAAGTKDNPHGGKELYERMIRNLGEGSLMARQELEGQFVLMEGLVYPEWNPDKHVVERKNWPVRTPRLVLIGQDFGFTAPCAGTVYGADGEGRRYVMDEFKQRGLAEKDLIRIDRVLNAKYKPRLFPCDDEDPRWIAALRGAGLPAVRAYKGRVSRTSPSSSIALCAQALRGPFYVDPKCKEFIKEIENYVLVTPGEMKNPKEAPRQYENHIMDSWRYAELWMDRLLKGGGQPAKVRTEIRA